MSDAVDVFFACWGTTDIKQRTDAISRACNSDFYYVDPNSSAPITTLHAMIAYLAQFSAMMPGASAQVVAQSAHNGHVRATVDFINDGKKMMRGQYFGDLDSEGKLTRVIGFTGTGEPE